MSHSHQPTYHAKALTVAEWENALKQVRKTKSGQDSKAQNNCAAVVSQLIEGMQSGIFNPAESRPKLNQYFQSQPVFLIRDNEFTDEKTTQRSYMTLGSETISYTSSQINQHIVPSFDVFTHQGKPVFSEFRGDLEKETTQSHTSLVEDLGDRLKKITRSEDSEWALFLIGVSPIEEVKGKGKTAEADAEKRLNLHTNGGHLVLAQVKKEPNDSFSVLYIDPVGDVGTDINVMLKKIVNIEDPKENYHNKFDCNVNFSLIDTEMRAKVRFMTKASPDELKKIKQETVPTLPVLGPPPKIMDSKEKEEKTITKSSIFLRESSEVSDTSVSKKLLPKKSLKRKSSKDDKDNNDVIEVRGFIPTSAFLEKYKTTHMRLFNTFPRRKKILSKDASVIYQVSKSLGCGRKKFSKAMTDGVINEEKAREYLFIDHDGIKKNQSKKIFFMLPFRI